MDVSNTSPVIEFGQSPAQGLSGPFTYGGDMSAPADTAIAHLAGALGRPVWLALEYAPDWHWGLEREDTPWYPTMRLFRQAAAGDWRAPFERMAAALTGVTAK